MIIGMSDKGHLTAIRLSKRKMKLEGRARASRGVIRDHFKDKPIPCNDNGITK